MKYGYGVSRSILKNDVTKNVKNFLRNTGDPRPTRIDFTRNSPNAVFFKVSIPRSTRLYSLNTDFSLAAKSRIFVFLIVERHDHLIVTPPMRKLGFYVIEIFNWEYLIVLYCDCSNEN